MRRIVRDLGRFAAAGAVSIALTGCLTTDNVSQFTQSALSLAGSLDTSVERQRSLASLSTSQILDESRESRDTRVERKLQRMVDRIVDANGLRDFDYKVHLLAKDRINAYTPGGGAIFVEEGLVAQTRTEAMMAMVLAHEIAHIVKAHPIKGMRDRAILNIGGLAVAEYFNSNTPGSNRRLALMLVGYAHSAAVSGFGRAAEAEADRLGFQYYVIAGYKPSAAPDIFDEFARINGSVPAIQHFFHGTHPQSHIRAARLRKAVARLGSDVADLGIEQTDEWARLVRRYASRRK